jgi:hypothetical protein
MKKSDRSWVWILDEDSDFRTLLSAFAPHFGLQMFDFENFEEAESAFLYYQEHVRKYPLTHCLRGVIASSPMPAPSKKPLQGIGQRGGKETSQEAGEVTQWLATIRRAFPDVKTIQLDRRRPQTVTEIFRLFKSLL